MKRIIVLAMSVGCLLVATACEDCGGTEELPDSTTPRKDAGTGHDAHINDLGRVDTRLPDTSTGRDTATGQDSHVGDSASGDAAGVPTTTIADLRGMATATPTDVNYRLDDVYVTYLRTAGYYVQAAQSGPGIYVYATPTSHGVAIGNKISLLVTRIQLHYGIAEISQSSVITNDQGSYDVANNLRQMLSGGAGTAPSADIESELVGLTNATIVSGSGHNWVVSYGSGDVTGNLYTYQTTTPALCVGAVFDLNSAIGSQYSGNYQIATYYAADFGTVNTSGCQAADAGPGDSATGTDATVFYDAAPQDASGVPTTTIADLRAAATATPTEVHYRLEDIYVTYTRGAGYYVQTVQSGPALFVYASPNMHGVARGNKISMLVNNIVEFFGVIETTNASVFANDHGSYDVANNLRQMLSTDTGTAPSEDLESELVGLTGATIVSGSGSHWFVSYGTTPVTAQLYAYASPSPALCHGAIFDLDYGVGSEYSSVHEIASYWATDFSNIVTTACPVPDDSNWGFEDWTQSPIEDFEYLTFDFTLTQETTLVHGGSSSGNLTWTSQTNQDLQTAYRYPVTPATDYTCHLWVYDNDNAGALRVGIAWYTSGGTRTTDWPGAGSGYSEDGAAWAEISHTATAPGDAATMSCIVRMYDTTVNWDGNATVYVDDLSITP